MTPDDLVALYCSPYSVPPLLALAGLDQVPRIFRWLERSRILPGGRAWPLIGRG